MTSRRPARSTETNWVPFRHNAGTLLAVHLGPAECRRGPYRRIQGPQGCRAQSSGDQFEQVDPYGHSVPLAQSIQLDIHSRESTAHIDDKGHLVESSPPPDSAAEALESLNDVEKGSADKATSSQVGGSVPMELDLPMIESLAEPTLSPEKGAEKAQTLDL
ncbi:hypothetical protein F5876DRAFT_82750 [Lentinula aff. lateritia]|uniref:Uncharacterized protein n=1 Tax=Lentinula aff. lateritia TaxID=2804960 RepID=A0ACC1TIX1_9AGAR|nr:hypothetical protein F5876DRAFT_82750 [Lentinula aff. lateritia]